MGLFAADAAPTAWERFSQWFSGTLVGELLIYFKTKYFSLRFGNYEHLPNDEATARHIEWILFALFIGILIASFAYLRHRRLSHRLLSAFKDAEADSPERAKTLVELGISKKRSLKRLLFRPTPFSRSVRSLMEVPNESGEGEKAETSAECESQEAPSDEVAEAASDEAKEPTENAKKEPENSVPCVSLSLKELESAKLFLPSEDLDTLLSRYRKRGHPALVMALTVVVSTIALALVMRLLPLILGVLDAIL